ncbi:hypothetical protein DHEL01_v210309 [Diaporthe helianthi]|uniref:GPI anchored protein n=1 Tax=Diaporthe helianthi TaxID=158607 RepID=A0A2P5HLZ6_DIAHE|nr:hypothetical protein DHEL01_v210309 [Diaporthe helianthi]
MQLTSILSAAFLPLVALAQDTTSGTTTLTQTSTMTKTVTLTSNSVTSNSVTMTAPTSSSIGTTSSVTRSSSRATATSSLAPSETPGVNGLGNGAASLGSSHLAMAGVAGMLVVALM